MNAHASEIKGSKIFHSWVLTSLILLLLTACNTQNSTQTPTPPTTTTSDLPNTVPTSTDSPLQIEIDYWPTDGWRTSTPEEQGMDSVKLAELIDYLQTQNSIDIHSLLIIRNGYIVTDAYFYPFERGFLHDLASATKSFTSTLIGIAIDQGYTESVEQPVLDFFPNRKVANLDAKKESLTLENLLTMRSGFQCSGEAIVRQMMASPDWTQFTLDLPMGTTPGTGYAYCSLNSHLLSAIIQEITG